MRTFALLFAAGLALAQEPSTITPPATPGAPTPPPAVAPEQPGPAPKQGNNPDVQPTPPFNGDGTGKPANGKSKGRKHRNTPPAPPLPTTAKQPPQPA